MKAITKSIAAILMLLPFTAMANGLDNSVSGSYFEGEFEHDTNHTLKKVEVRKSVWEDEDYSVYGIGMYEDYSHPILDYNEWVGVGVQRGGVNIEAHYNEDHFRYSARYTGSIDDVVITTAFTHSDKWEGQFSQTSLNSGVGYRFDDVIVMAEYTVGNVTMRSVNDWYGLTVRWQY